MTDSDIVQHSHAPFAPTRFEVTPFRPPRPGERRHFEVNLIANAEAGMRKRAVVKPNLEGWSPFEIACDEGTALGGEDSAPPPLAYLAAGVAFCLLTHLQGQSRRWGMQLDTLRVEQRMRFSNGPPETAEAGEDIDDLGCCEGVEIHVIAEGSETPERIQTLVDHSRQACMALQSLANATPHQTHVHLNGQALDASGS